MSGYVLESVLVLDFDLFLCVYIVGVFLMVDSCDVKLVYWVELKMCVIFLLGGFYLLKLFCKMMLLGCYEIIVNCDFVGIVSMCVELVVN